MKSLIKCIQSMMMLFCGLLSLISSTMAAPLNEQPVTQQSVMQQPVTQQPVTQQTVTQQPVNQSPTQQPVMQQTTTQPQTMTITTTQQAQPSNPNLTAEEQSFFDSHIKDIVIVTPTRLTNDRLTRVFSAIFYSVKIKILLGSNSSMSQDSVFIRDGNNLKMLPDTVTNQSLPELLSLIRPDFKLKTMADAEKLQDALNILYPVDNSFGDQKAVINNSILQNGNTWTIIRGKFFDKNKGFVITTAPDGTITAINYSLDIIPTTQPTTPPVTQ